MKTILLVVTILVGFSFLWGLQQAELKNLSHEKKKLQTTQRTKNKQSFSPRVHRLTASAPEVSNEEVMSFQESFLVEFLELEAAGKDFYSNEAYDRKNQHIRLARNFSTANLATLIESIRTDNRVTDPDRVIDQMITQIFVPAAPFTTLECIRTQGPIMEGNDYLAFCFAQCLLENPRRALQIYQEEAPQDNRFHKGRIQFDVLITLAAIDPHEMLALASSKDLQENTQSLLKKSSFIGREIVKQLDSAKDYASFLALVQQAHEEDPSSDSVAQIRKSTVEALSSEVTSWPFDEAQLFLNAGFTEDERFQAYSRTFYDAEIRSREQWANHLLKIELANWQQWAKKNEVDNRHPLHEFMCRWPFVDAKSANNFLERMPVSDLRDQILEGYPQLLPDH